VSILDVAKEVIEGKRQDDYGTPLINNSRIAALWTVYIESKKGEPLTAEDVCMMNVLQKVARAMNSITNDTLVDIAGYAAIIEKIKSDRGSKSESPP
jgi:hypothetical protein